MHNAVPRRTFSLEANENLGGVFGSNQVSLYFDSQSSLSLFLLGPNQPLFDNSKDNSFLALLSSEGFAALLFCHFATVPLRHLRQRNVLIPVNLTEQFYSMFFKWKDEEVANLVKT